MKRLVRSTKTGIFCTQCDKSIPVNTSRIIDGGMHSHYECLNKGKVMSEWISVDDKKPVSEKPFYWVLFPEDEIAMCRFNDYGQFGGCRNYWQDMNNDDIRMHGTKWIEIKKPEPPKE